MFRALVATALLLRLSQAGADEYQGTLLDADVRRASDIEYSRLLEAARLKGWNYPAEQVAHGFKRHYDELKLRLQARGYRIIESEASL